MFPGNDSLSTAMASAKEQALNPLAEECVETLELDRDQIAVIESFLQAAWFFGVRAGHAVMLETKMGQTDPAPAILGMRDEFQDLMERCADSLDSTVGTTIAAWNYLGRAWIAGAKFWEVEIAARLIEQKADGLEDQLRKLWE